MTAALWILVVLALAWVIYAIRKTETAPLHEDWDVPVPLRSTGPSAEEVRRQKRYNRSLSDRIDLKVKRAVRPATREEILAAKDKSRAMALIRDAGGC